MSWSKVEKSTGTNTAVDKRDKGWFTAGWFSDWLSGILWRKVEKITGACEQVSKDTEDFTKVSKSEGEWNKVEKE